jgi:hypothetical protein
MKPFRGLVLAMAQTLSRFGLLWSMDLSRPELLFPRTAQEYAAKVLPVVNNAWAYQLSLITSLSLPLI